MNTTEVCGRCGKNQSQVIMPQSSAESF